MVDVLFPVTLSLCCKSRVIGTDTKDEEEEEEEEEEEDDEKEEGDENEEEDGVSFSLFVESGLSSSFLLVVKMFFFGCISTHFSIENP